MPNSNSWSPEHSVKIAELDAQHQRLFRIVQDLEGAIAAGRGQQAIEAIIDRAVNYTIDHFSTEEGLMEQYGYPGLAAHRIEHNKLTLEISNLQKEHSAESPDAAERFLKFLRKWFDEHILKSDQEYAPFLGSKGLK